MRKAEIEDEVLLAFTVDTAGYASLSTVRLLQGRHRQFFDAVLNVLPAMKFNPAEVEGHKVRGYGRHPFSVPSAEVACSGPYIFALQTCHSEE